jgi:hypothetical protein
MANRFAVANGNWSSPSTWDGLTTVPTSADDVYANGRTVTIDVSPTVLSIRNGSASGIAAGGGFALNSGVTLTATSGGFVGSVSGLVTFSVVSPASATITGNVSAVSSTTTAAIQNNGTGTLYVNGSVSCPNNSIGIAIRNNSSGTIQVTGNSVGGSVGQNSGGSCINNSSGVFKVIGDVTAGVGNGYACQNISSGRFEVTGNATGSANGFAAMGNSGIGDVYVTGTATGGSATPAIQNLSTGTVTFTGTATAGAGAVALSNSSSGTFTHSGSAIASSSTPAISSAASGIFYATGPFIGTAQGVIANQAIRWRWIQAVGSSYMTAVNSTATGYKNLYTADSTLSNSGQPGISSVRLGTIYGPNSELTGTLAMPLPSQVYIGAPVDNTVGTAALNGADIWNYPISGITTSGSIGERLKTAATVNVMGQLISDSFSAK